MKTGVMEISPMLDLKIMDDPDYGGETFVIKAHRSPEDSRIPWILRGKGGQINTVLVALSPETARSLAEAILAQLGTYQIPATSDSVTMTSEMIPEEPPRV